MASFMDRFRGAFNVFARPGEDNTNYAMPESDRSAFYGGSYAVAGVRTDRSRLRISNDKSIIPSIYTRISIDVASIDIRHTRHDSNDRYVEDISSGLNNCLQVEANVDQAARSFIQDIVLMCFDKGAAAVVAVDTTEPTVGGSFDVKTLRVGEIKKWMADRVTVDLYNDRTGGKQLITLPKSQVAIIENPFYMVMNEPNGTLSRLTRKLNMLDSVDEATSSGKLDLIIQLPYVIRTEQKRQQAAQRAEDIEYQLRTNQHGIAYTDGTEKITQLNRPAENNLLGQIEYLTKQLFDQLGLTPDVMNGTAPEAVMLNYLRRTCEPILQTIVQEFARKFLTKTARSQGQRIEYFANPFNLIPMAQLAEIADKLSRNEVVTSNELRGFIGLKPSSEPKADQLVNSNMPVDDTGVQLPPPQTDPPAPPPLSLADLEKTDDSVSHSDAGSKKRTPTLRELQRLGPLTHNR